MRILHFSILVECFTEHLHIERNKNLSDKNTNPLHLIMRSNLKHFIKIKTHAKIFISSIAQYLSHSPTFFHLCVDAPHQPSLCVHTYIAVLCAWTHACSHIHISHWIDADNGYENQLLNESIEYEQKLE